MTGETELEQLLRELRPLLCARRYSFSVAQLMTPTPETLDVWARIEEDEGTTIIAAENCGGAIVELEAWARITLGVHSSLNAVGLTAHVAGVLAAANIPANVIAGFYHDHIFVPWLRRDEAIGLLTLLSESA
ncbi:MAG: ACT domain-containing protein [Allosphingosinicella sp.]